MLYVLELVFMVLWTLGIVTQVAIPALEGRPLFPILREEGAIRERLNALRQKRLEKRLLKQQLDLQKEVEDKCEPEH